MDLEYDNKFEEMKQYIPFLESMIKRLELTSSSSNPRQAQLDKIRSLRDLLLDKKKRMKMENLLKCEQVLVNLYAKVEQSYVLVSGTIVTYLLHFRIRIWDGNLLYSCAPKYYLPLQNTSDGEPRERDTLPGIQMQTESMFPSESSKAKDKNDLDSVRNKLKTVTKSIREDPDTLPEIARASETEEVCTPGSKEPALFQRRPNKASSPKKSEQTPKIKGHVFTRVFTRVLKSPEPTDRRWSLSEKNPDKPLFSRRSPRRSPRRHTPPHYKKDRKKSSRPNKIKDLNITLNVPEDSLNSLNTDDILSRIINCSDGDVDIDTLRDLRTQILGELKQTGANDDISDLILKSYKKKKKYGKRKVEVEEGELSDSESEAIDNIYGSLIVVDKDKGTSKQAMTSEKEADSGKIQICLVINSDKDSPVVKKDNLDNISNDDFEMFDDIEKPQEHEKPKEKVSLDTKKSSSENKTQGKVSSDTKKTSSENKTQEKISLENKKSSSQNKSQGKVSLETKKFITESNSQSDKNQNQTTTPEVITIDDDEEPKVIKPIKSAETVTQTKCIDISESPTKNEPTKNDPTKKEEADAKPFSFKPNFYKPMNEEDNLEKAESQIDTEADKSQFNTALTSHKPKICDKPETKTSSEPTNLTKPGTKTSSESTSLAKPETKTSSNPTDSTANAESSSLNMKELESKKVEEVKTDRPESPPVEIPLLNEPTVPAPPPKKDAVSEIDILQALKNEILSESITIPGSDVVTPALHQPKLTKVSSAQELMKKKRISIEKYKQKSVPTSKLSLFLKDPKSSMSKEDYAKKQSLKLTEKECERFNFPVKLALDESSDEDITDEYSLDDIYRDLAPESPENEQFTETGNVSPVIIPAEPVKAPTVATKTDIDMRTMPLFSPAAATLPASNPMSPSVGNESPAIRNERIHEQNKRPPLFDPRVRRENRSINLESPNPHVVNPDRTPRSANFPNMTPNSRTFEMTPSRHSIDSDDSTSKKHVYSPMFSSYDPWEHRQQSESRDMYNKQGQRVQWETNVDTTNEIRRSRWDTENRDSRIWDDRHSRSSDPRWEDRNPRSSVQRDVDYQKSRYNESDNYHRNSRNDRYGHDKRDDYPYSRLECPSTPSHSFGRSDCPATPTPSFGRLEAPMTPVHPFGRSECPTTPIHPFGRADCPSTPSHSFGRSECPTTPSHPFGRSDCPTTPIHPFGRSDIGMAPMTPNHPFGRSDYSQNPMNTVPKLVKDPRLNRTDSDSSSHTYNDDSGYYNDRRKSDVQSRHFNAMDSHRNYGRDQSVRSDRNRSYEQSGRSYNRDQSSHYEPGMGRGNKDYETTNLYTRERGGRNDDYRKEADRVRNTDEPNRSFQRAHSVGRRTSAEESFVPSSSRQGRDYRNETVYDNKLSVKPQTGSSFTIDTSVNKTFLEFLNGKGLQVFDYSFDARRQRASSVGRSLTRESSVGRTKRESSVGRTLPEPIFDNSRLMRKDFVRARSMGRDMADIKTEKSLKDIKADFESYSAKYKRKENIEVPKAKEQSQYTKTMNYRDPRSRKIDKEKEIKERSNSASKSVYSPRKNSRDPRMSRDRFETKSRYKIDRRRNDGIVYSNDNIAKGTILGSGYGVKNYKIPKIKRVEPEVKPEIEKTKTTDNKDKAVIDKVTEKKTNESTAKSKVFEKKEKESKVNVKVNEGKLKVKGKDKSLGNKTTPEAVELDDNIKSVTVDQTKKRTTRSSRKSEATDTKLSDDDSVMKRRPRKPVIYDSDSDSETVNENKDSDIKTSTKTESPKKLASPSKTKKTEKKDEVLNCSFGMDDLEIFPDNMASDPVMDNINALIADLDNDIDSSKQEDSNNKFASDINLEKILSSFSSPDRTQDLAEDVSFKDITEFIKEDLDRSNSKSQEHQEEHTGTPTTKTEDPIEKDKENNQMNIIVTASQPDKIETVKVMPDAAEMKVILPDKSKQISNDSVNPDKESTQSIINNEAIDSTTKNDKEICKKVEEKAPEDLNNAERSLTPDSTNTEMQSSDKMGLPDSTNEIQNEMNSDITSTEVPVDSSKDVAEPSSSKEESNKLDSIGNLLSILQDKSKIKELLSMLGDHSSDNEKIKKKLEKLSEIVSDDENTNDIENQEKQPESDTKEHETTEENKILEMKTDLSDDKKDTDKENIISEEKAGVEDKHIEDTITNQNGGSETAEMSKLGDEAVVQETDNASQSNVKKPRKVPLRRGRKGKWKTTEKPVVRVTRQAANVAKKPKIARELKRLQDDIKEMFISNDVLNSTGIRMCRLAKLVDEKSTNHEEETVILPKDVKPVVVLEKFKGAEEALLTGKIKKKPMPKSKAKASIENSDIEDKKEKTKPPPKYKPGPKSKTKPQQEDPDPYTFDPDSVSETNTLKETENDLQNSSESDNDSLSSSKSFGSSEVLAELKKKPKRKRNSWKTGVIKPKKKKKIIAKELDPSLDDDKLNSKNHSENEDDKNTNKISIPDLSCFTDKKYCFSKGVAIYSCRLCQFSGTEIVHHYKRNHPHSEIPLSRMSPKIAKEAIDQCEDINFQAICQVRSWKHVCRFCFKEFNGRGRGNKANKLEEFFWHVVSTHTGEYKQLCSDCINVTRCPFNLDIPPPPKEVKGQLLGYICGKCNFTQISLENLKTHVIVRHNDEQTAVYTINLGMMTKKTIEALMKRSENIQNIEQPRVLRSGRSNQSYTDTSDARSEITDSTDLNSELELSKRRSKVYINVPAEKSSNTTFENDMNSEVSNAEGTTLKVETDDNEDDDETFDDRSDLHDASETETEVYQRPISDDIFDCAHFKVSYTETGMKEYVCCVNGKDNHYKTSLLISMKKHIQHKHSEKWDGYCYVCKLIVTSQGDHRFKECFQHYLDKHIDNFPILETVKPVDAPESVSESSTPTRVEMIPPKPYINVRPISDLIAQDMEPTEENEVALPVIESVVSLGTATTPQAPSPGPSSIYSEPSTSHDAAQTTPVQIPQKQYKYEEAQSEVMTKKLRAVLDAMLSAEKLVKIYKCAGRFCSFTSDSAEDALLHASTHQRIGGQNALICAYCDFDCAGNAIDLVMHVFKAHGCCQYVCRQCFYRSSSSQLVRAHMLRMHGAEVAKEAVLMTDIVTPIVDDRSEILSRDVAVQHYFCQDMETSCKFKTYTQGKFCEHLFKHQPPYLCFVCIPLAKGKCGIYAKQYTECLEGFLTPTELTNHLKTHGLNLYQCTWCVHGADNEVELLAHSSEKHPTKQPQAYLRIITTKEGTSKMMVLPLAQLNKSKVRVEAVIMSNNTENPLRDAERSIELERLIGSMPSIEPKITEAPKEPEKPPEVQPDIASADGILLEPMEPRLSTPPPNTSEGNNQSFQRTPVLKTEPQDETPVKGTTKNDVICLDSDEEDSRDSTLGVIALSDDEATKDSNNESKKITPRFLFKCSKCRSVYKTKSTFKRHIHTSQCFPEPSEIIKCAHCSFSSTRGDLYLHYDTHDSRVSGQANLGDRFVCGICGFSEVLLRFVRNHVRVMHGAKNVVVNSQIEDGGPIVYTVNPKPGPKRKLSTSKIETPPKKKRYSPLEVQQLPTKPILDELVYCSLCEFNTKVRLNMVRHLQQHAEQQPVAETVPVNPVPHLESNEKHFDKMVNLASSSIVNRAPDKPARVENNPAVNLVIPPEAASRYPKYVPERQRHTCGAKGCSYTSLNEGMLKRHWEALHTGTIDFHCVHCPPYQHLDTSKPLTASRIIAHLKMHDVTLYACSSCTYYHYKKPVVEKHLSELHKDAGQVLVVREEAAAQQPAISQPATSAPTMDLKPWQCGLCKFKSMLRPEVIEHCAKFHNTKMQFKCPNCPFRGSNLENVAKHQQNSHPGSTEETFYYYYREGSIPDQVDGTPRWVKQRQKMAVPDSEVKTEVTDNTVEIPAPPLVPISAITPAVDLNIVKKETVEPVDESTEDLCARFGQFCEPNGLKYKCPLCKVVIEDSKDVMQSHLFEELKYRKWGCSICSYKAFHITGLNDHMSTEHRQNQTPVELPVDTRVETWVAKLLEYQTTAMEKNRENLSKQRVQVDKPSTSTNVNTQNKPPETSGVDKPRAKELEDAFGKFGEAKNNQFCCPKCDFQNKDESLTRDHLESELNQIRWRCSNCSDNYQNYHEAQLHCKSVHAGEAARPIDAARDPALRTAWINAVLSTQKTSINTETDTSIQEAPTALSALDNSLLVVRYEERVPTPEAEMLVRRKRPAPAASTSNTADSDDERLVIDETTDESTPEKQDTKKKNELFKCPHCDHSSKYKQALEEHIFRHYNIKPYKCNYCNFTCHMTSKAAHHEKFHLGNPYSFSKSKLPEGPPVRKFLVNNGKEKKGKAKKETPNAKEDAKLKDDAPKVVCLYCETAMSDIEARTHTHENKLVQFGKKGEAVVKCCICFALLLNVTSMLEHHNANHPSETINYAFYKLYYDSREIHQCGHCDIRFKFLRDLRTHHNALHSSLQLKYVTKPHLPGGDEDEERESDKRKSEDSSIYPSAKRIAKKSTTKLPVQTKAKKSKTLVSDEDSESDIDEYSFYGTNPPNTDEQSNVTTHTPISDTVKPVDVKTSSENNSNTATVVKDLNK